MDDVKYINERLNDQINWYDKKSQWNQRWFKRFQLSNIIAAAVIPFLSSFAGEISYYPWLVGVLGIYIAVSAAAISLYKFQENWIQYRTTAEQLKHEKYLYLTGAGPYNGETRFQEFVKRVESLISKENSAWAKLAANSDPEGDDR